MKRKGLWLTGLGLAALLTISQNADAGFRWGLRVGPPPWRHEVIVERPGPGRIWFAGHRGWDRDMRVWTPGIWNARRPGLLWRDGWRWHRHEGRAYLRGYWRGYWRSR